MRVSAILRTWSVAAGAVLLLLALRLPFLAPTLEDVDSVNFDLGVHDYNPALHRPHPPGYPLYIALAKASHAVIQDHATALAALAALFSALAVIPLYALMKELTTRAGAVLACVFTVFNPLLWLNSVRPMSDLVGFCAATTAQALLLTSGTIASGRWHAVAFFCGAIAGIRLQSLLLTVPLLCYVAARDGRSWWRTAGSVGMGVAAWAVPLIVLMGGLQTAAASFAAVVSDTLNEDALVPQWTLRSAVFAARDVIFSPWPDPVTGSVLVGLAGIGALTWAWTAPRRLIIPLLLFAPYGMFHYVVQDTGTLRYTIPAIPLTALLASIPLTQWRIRTAAVPLAAVTFVTAASFAALPALQAYSVTPSPMMQAVDALATRAASERVVVSGHFAFERYLPLLPDRLERLLLVHAKEWQSLTESWTGGRRDPVLFLREAHRTDHLQFGRDTQTTVGHWEWPAAVRPFLRGARPGSIDLVRLDPPRWAIESGVFVTDEAGPYERVTREPHRFHVLPSQSRQVLILSGSTDSARGPVELSLRYGATFTRSWRAEGDFGLRTFLPPITSDRYVPVSLHAGAPVAITDVWVTGDTQPAIRPAKGFYLPERDAAARVFRWIAGEARATAYMPHDTAQLTIEGWMPVEYVNGPVTLSLAWNGRPVASVRVESGRFRRQLHVARTSADPWSELTISSSRSFVPDDLTRNGDRRVLSLRIYELGLD